MHEMSIAESLIEVAASHVPAGSRLTAVRMVAGPMRGIEQEAMQWAWRSVLEMRGMASVLLELSVLPWTMRCARCGGEWKVQELAELCECGGPAGPVGGDELQLVGLEVEEAAEGGQ